MSAPDSVIDFLAERGPAPAAEIARALSDQYGYNTVRNAVGVLKRRGLVVDTGERESSGGRARQIVALERELERARRSGVALEAYRSDPKEAPVTIIQRVKRWFGVK
jgi:DNA-binding IclR family transcriptional regulator